MYKVVVDIAPRTIKGTNGCHKYVFGEYGKKREAASIAGRINSNKKLGIATVEKTKI